LIDGSLSTAGKLEQLLKFLICSKIALSVDSTGSVFLLGFRLVEESSCNACEKMNGVRIEDSEDRSGRVPASCPHGNL
jgi:hypothetical protein